jgi:Plasmid pRiA4b ORF-3-like protein
VATTWADQGQAVSARAAFYAIDSGPSTCFEGGMSAPTPTNYGICALCGKRIAKSSASRHMVKCAADHDPKKGSPCQLVELRIQAEGVPEFWLQIEVKSSARLRSIDQFLRDTWLECCGHLSQFIVGRTRYESTVDPAWAQENTRSMSCTVGEVFSRAGATAAYEYDLGTTTALEIKVVRVREAHAGRQAVRLLARNEPPCWVCAVCGQPATTICTECLDGDLLCDEHAESHGCDDEMFLPVVNSPRAGACGYCG